LRRRDQQRPAAPERDPFDEIRRQAVQPRPASQDDEIMMPSRKHQATLGISYLLTPVCRYGGTERLVRDHNLVDVTELFKVALRRCSAHHGLGAQPLYRFSNRWSPEELCVGSHAAASPGPI
jgi:hypothetical protein